MAERLKPKMVISENVKGLVLGNAKIYARKILEKFSKIGYDTQIFLLNGATMGLPQMRTRTFFISRRRDLKLPALKIKFEEAPIPFRKISDESDTRETLTELYYKYWDNTVSGYHLGKFETRKKVHPDRPMYTIVAGARHWHYKYRRELNDRETCLGGSWPLDYNFNGQDANYIIGMSVPPLMMGKLAEQVYKQQLSKCASKRD